MTGALDALSRRAGRRPLRWFLGLWAILTAVWLLSGAIHFRLDRRADIPPVPEVVPYAYFLPGGARYDESVRLELDPQRLPHYDRLRRRPARYYFNTWPDENGGSVRLVCQFFTVQGAYGWPRRWVRWSRWKVYDVTDPNRPFERARPRSQWRHVNWELHQLSWSIRTGDESTWWNGAWKWRRMLGWWLSLEAVAAMFVVGLWSWDGARYRRRLRHGWCVVCGYDLQAHGGGGMCPECGRGQPPARPQPLFGAGRVFLGGWALLVVAGIAVAMLAPTEREFPDLEGRLDELARETLQLAPRLGGSRNVAHFMVAEWDYGWPLGFATLVDVQTWACLPGERPSVWVSPNIAPGVSAFEGGIQWSRATDDPTVYRHLELYWSYALVQIAGLQFVALAGAGLLAAFRQLRSRGWVARA